MSTETDLPTLSPKDTSPTEMGVAPSQSVDGFGPVLRNPKFLVLWLGQIFSQLADKIYLVLMIALIASHFQTADQSISAWVSAIMIAFTVPAILFGSVAGVYVDRWSKKGVLIISNLLRGVFVFCIPLLLWLVQDQPNWWELPPGFVFLLGITFAVSTLTQFFAPAEQATLPLIVKNKHLLAANSLYTTTMMALLIVGFAVGEPLLGLADQLVESFGITGTWGKEFVVGGGYAIAGLILLALKTNETETDRQREQPHVWEDIQDGLSYLNQNHRVRNALIQLVILFSVFAALAVLAVSLAAQIPGLKAEQFGFLLAAGGVGLGIGAFFLGHWGNQLPYRTLSLWGSIGTAIALIALSFSIHNLVFALVSTTCLGFFAALVGVPMQTTIQRETPAILRGKVFGLQNNAVNIALSLPLALAGVAETFFGLQPVLLGLSGLAIAGGVLNWYISIKS
ncbi:MFS transporter [Synechococcus sp. 7002]|uniref:MFS transporter n=2 Tax=Cyanobacteriota TaxID=1117 RepID=UPI00016DC6E3|nr:MFS transporter [Synechococcus sp. 7002]ACA98724.1 multidrug efflux transporter, MFS family protein [Picosynechococcus sp. PCC 7002]SMH39490.1 Transmembrane secretion effector [Picosynechococcus sp. OG1]SMQ78193.1 Transmembrane secretion effector [Synechococcus sp. 7002]